MLVRRLLLLLSSSPCLSQYFSPEVAGGGGDLSRLPNPPPPSQRQGITTRQRQLLPGYVEEGSGLTLGSNQFGPPSLPPVGQQQKGPILLPTSSVFPGQPPIASFPQPDPVPTPLDPPLGGQPSALPGPPPPGVATGQQLQCHIRSCDQTITGRRLSYARALEIVQGEEYLTVADTDIIRRRLRREVWREALLKRRKDIRGTRVKRQCSGTPSENLIGAEEENHVKKGLVAALVFGLLQIATAPANPPPPQPPAAPPAAPPATPTFSAALPGAVGGGILPLGTSFVVLTAVALAPPGTTPVAAFPPYLTPRTFDAVSVIFREDDAALVARRRTGRKRTVLGRAWNRLSRLSGRLTPRFSLRGGRPRLRKRGIARRLVRAGKRFFGGLNKLTWSRGTDRDYRDHSHFGGYAGHGGFSSSPSHGHHQGGGGYGDPQGLSSFETDLFGFRSKVTLVRDQPCALGVTCDEGGNRIGGGALFASSREFFHAGEGVFLRRQTGEEFEADGPPECRIELNPNGCVALP